MISIERACRIAARWVDELRLEWTGKFIAITDMGDCWVFGPEYLGDGPTGYGAPEVSKRFGFCRSYPGTLYHLRILWDAPRVEIPEAWRAENAYGAGSEGA